MRVIVHPTKEKVFPLPPRAERRCAIQGRRRAMFSGTSLEATPNAAASAVGARQRSRHRADVRRPTAAAAFPGVTDPMRRRILTILLAVLVLAVVVPLGAAL